MISDSAFKDINSELSKVPYLKGFCFAGGFALTCAVIKPKSVLGYLGAVTAGILGGFTSIMLQDLAESAFKNLVNDRYYKQAPKLIEGKSISLLIVDKVLERIKKNPNFSKFLVNISAEQILGELKKGSCQGQSIVLLNLLREHYNTSCIDLLKLMKVEDALYQQIIHRYIFAEFYNQFPRIIGGNLHSQLFPAIAPISVYKYFIEKAVANVKEDEIVAGEICISQVKGHVMTFQFSEGCYRLYDAENGFYFYPSAKEFYEHTRNLLLGKHAEFGSKGYNLLVQIKIYAIKKEVSRNSE